MEKYIPLEPVVAEIERRIDLYDPIVGYEEGRKDEAKSILSFIVSLEVKDVDLLIHTVIAECCDWLAMNTNLSHDKIEGCRNLMLTVKEEQLKEQKGE